MNNQNLVIAIIVIVVAVIVGLIFFMKPQPSETPASAPPAPETPASAPLAPEIPVEYQQIAEDATQIVAGALHVSPDEVTVLSVQKVTWSDASLGCPEPGMMYAQVLTPGYLVATQVNGATQNVHMNEKGQGTVCPPERARPPAQTE